VFGRSKGLVGLDIGSSAVKAVELAASGKSYRVAAYASETMAPDSIVDGAIIDGAGVADTIRRVFERLGTKTNELAESIKWEAEQYIPFDIQDVNLDYQIVQGTDGGAKGSMDVLLIAAKKEKIADYTGVITQAGRLPVVVDVDAFAMQNAFEANYDVDPSAVTVLMNMGASAVNINIVSGPASIFTRDVSIGGNAYTEAVQREFNLTFTRAEAAKHGTGGDERADEVDAVLRAVSDNVLLEIQKTFDFYRSTAVSDRLDRVMLCGGAARVHGFAGALADRFGLPVEPLNPFRRIAFDAGRAGVDADEAASTAVVAVGLALRRAGDR
jgi:type IV pilus assembly protein PilM